MIELLDEVYKPGLADDETHAIAALEPLGRSFMAFQARLSLEKDSLVVWNDLLEEAVDPRVPVRRLRLSAPPYTFQAFRVAQVGGIGDPLLPFRSASLRAGEYLTLLFLAETGEAPAAAAARLMLSLVLAEGEQAEECAELPIRPIPYTLPAPKDYLKKIDLWQHNTCIARYYGVGEYSDAHFALMKPYFEALAQLGQRSVTVLAAHKPWDGQRRGLNGQARPASLFEAQMVRVTRTAAGLDIDFSPMDQVVALAAACGIADEIELFGLCGAWTERSLVAVRTPSGLGYLSEDEMESYIAALYRHIQQMGWAERTVVCADEPQDAQRFEHEIRRLRRLAPGLRLKGALDHPAFADRFGQALSVVVPSFFTACRRLPLLRSLPGSKTWYICCSPNKPNTFLSSPLPETRALCYLNEIFGFDGLLRWAFTAWPEDPYREAAVGPWEPGDTFLIYPGRDGRPVLSLRYLQLRRMAEDQQLLAAVRDPMRYAARIFYTTDPEQFEIDGWAVRGALHTLSFRVFEETRRAMAEELRTR